MQAIKSILRRTSGSAPYLLVGPAGTGKTATVVEAIYQLWIRSAPKICICASSNSAVDVVVKRLLGRDKLEDNSPVPPPKLQKNVMRVYAKTRERDEKLLDCSTKTVLGEILKEKRIIATTTITAGWLVDKGFGKNWFDYLFIDEAGQGTEANILIPIAGFLHDKCHLVLAGDPKQLGPVVTSPLAKALGWVSK
ncbi:Helicase MOV-10 [Sarracenia purpurea var. burkii]